MVGLMFTTYTPLQDMVVEMLFSGLIAELQADNAPYLIYGIRYTPKQDGEDLPNCPESCGIAAIEYRTVLIHEGETKELINIVINMYAGFSNYARIYEQRMSGRTPGSIFKTQDLEILRQDLHEGYVFRMKQWLASIELPEETMAERLFRVEAERQLEIDKLGEEW